jgi:hypothetical protein
MPAEVFKLVIDNSNLVSGLKASEAQAASSTNAISASLQKMGTAGADGSKGIHLVNDSLKMTRKEINESKGSIAMLGEMLGVHIPRHARGMIASLEMIGPALNMAFNAVAVIAIGMAFVEAGKKLYEFFKKSEEASEKAKKANEELASSLNKSNLEEAVAIDKIEKHIAVLEKKPYNGLKAAIDEAVLSTVTLAEKLDKAIQKERELLQAQDHGFMAQNLQGRGGTEASQNYLNKYNAGQNNVDLDFQTQLDELMKRGATQAEVDALEQRHIQAKANLTKQTYNTVKEELAARKELAALTNQSYYMTPHIAELQKRFGSGTEDTSAMEQMLGNLGMLGHGQQLDATMQSAKVTEGTDEETKRMEDLGKKSAEAKLRAQQAAIKSFVSQSIAAYKDAEAESDRISQAITATWEEGRKADAEASKKADEVSKQAANDYWSAFNRGAAEHISSMEKLRQVQQQIALSTGQITPHDAAIANATSRQAAFNVEMVHYGELLAQIDRELKAGRITPEQAGAQREGVAVDMHTATDKNKIQSTEDNQAVYETSAKGAIGSVFNTIIESANHTQDKLKQIATQTLDALNTELAKGMTGGKMNFKQVGQNAAQGLAKSSLEKLEGSALSALGLGGAGKLGTKGNPMYTKSADSGMPGMGGSGIGGGLMGMANDNNWLSSLFGGKLFGAGGLFGGFADGGYTGSDPILVGEKGPEIFNPGKGGFVTPNHKLGGTSTIVQHIDARGTDPVQSQAAMERAMRQTHAQSVADSGRAMQEQQRRSAH